MACSVERHKGNLVLALHYGPGVSAPRRRSPRGNRFAYLPPLRPARFALSGLAERYRLEQRSKQWVEHEHAVGRKTWGESGAKLTRCGLF